jgi:hypothetical protein
VEISLNDANGKSYVYGYIPIIIAKCVLFLKEKGNTVYYSTTPKVTAVFPKLSLKRDALQTTIYFLSSKKWPTNAFHYMKFMEIRHQE